MIDNNILFQKLAERFNGSSVITGLSFGEPVVTVPETTVRQVLSFLKDDAELSYSMLVELFAIDCFGEDPRFEIVYILRSLKNNGRVTVKTKTGDEGIDTVSDMWKAADWLEREVYDMFGIPFRNHQDLRRIYNTDDFEGYPLRKDFPTEGYDFDKPFVVTFEEEKA
jgi:NADH-quinone oxidoreductase subunit C